MLIGYSILIWFELSISMFVSQLIMDWLVILFYVPFSYTNLLLIFAFPSIVLYFFFFFFVAFSVVFTGGSFSYNEEDYCQKGWQEAEDRQYQVQVPLAFWEIHSVLQKGNHHLGKICRLSGFEGHFHSKLLWGQRLG